ncbi:hypothetical protein KY319_02895 [Candidatus Woesearchaeota archaeon]|nr:hypothetical protein [Candidatus Woesearchaeota archaeon]
MKKAQTKTTLIDLFTLVIGFGIVFLSIMYSVMEIGTNEAFRNQLYITSLGMELQSMQSLGQDINAIREIQDAGPQTLVFESGKAYIRERVPINTFLFTQIPELVFTGGEFTPDKSKTIGPITMFKTGNRYGVARPSNVPSQYLLYCETPKGNPLAQIKLISEANTQILADRLKAGRTIFQQKYDAKLILTQGNTKAVKAYYNTEEARRLACEILNEITNEYKIPVRPIPINTEHISKNDPKYELKDTKPAVILEIDPGITKESQLSVQIYKGLENYGVV